MSDHPPSRQALLEAAIDALAIEGPDGVSIEGVARRAGYNKSLVYRHFGGREGLYTAALAAALVDDSPWHDLPTTAQARVLARALRARVEAMGDRARLLAFEHQVDPPADPDLRRARHLQRLRECGAGDEAVTRARWLGALATALAPALLPRLTAILLDDGEREEALEQALSEQIERLGGPRTASGAPAAVATPVRTVPPPRRRPSATGGVTDPVQPSPAGPSTPAPPPAPASGVVVRTEPPPRTVPRRRRRRRPPGPDEETG